MWDTSTGQTLVELRGHTGVVQGVAFSPDGERLVTAGGDRTARVWDSKTGSRLLILRGHTALVNSAVFSPDGRHIVTASVDNTAQVHVCDLCGALEDLLALANRRRRRELTVIERQIYLHE